MFMLGIPSYEFIIKNIENGRVSKRGNEWKNLKTLNGGWFINS